MSASVYFFRIMPDGPIKIGFSNDPMRRLADIQCCVPYQIELLGIVDGGAKLEGELHERFQRFRIRGEWFNPAEELLNFIASATVESSCKNKPGVTHLRETVSICSDGIRTSALASRIDLSSSITVLGLPSRVINCLVRHDKYDPQIKTIGELIRLSPENLLDRRNFGEVCLSAVVSALNDLNLSLNMHPSYRIVQAPFFSINTDMLSHDIESRFGQSPAWLFCGEPS